MRTIILLLSIFLVFCILLACEEAARGAGFSRFELVSTLTGVPLYVRHGYVEVERVTLTLPNSESYAAVRMRKD